MVLHAVISVIVRSGIRKGARYIYEGLRTQDKLVDATYRKTGLYNRGVVRGIKHGLAGGQIVGGILKLGLAPDTPGNGFQTQIRKQSPSRKPDKARNRYPKCPSGRYRKN